MDLGSLPEIQTKLDYRIYSSQPEYGTGTFKICFNIFIAPTVCTREITKEKMFHSNATPWCLCRNGGNYVFL